MKKIKLLIYTLFSSVLSLQAQTVIFSENFESGTLPTGWSVQQEPGSSGWQLGDVINLSSNYFTIPTHTNFVASNDDICNCDMSNDLIISPAIDLSTTTQPVLTFASFFNGHHSSTGSILFSLDGITWEYPQSIFSSSQWKTQSIDLTYYAGVSSLYIAFKHDDNGAWASGVAIDDIIITEPVFYGNTILRENFNSCSMPVGWSKAELQGGFGFEFASTDSIRGDGFNNLPSNGIGCIAGINDARYDNATGTANISDDYLYLPVLDLSNIPSAFIDVDVYVGGVHYLRLKASTDGINWTTVAPLFTIEGWRTMRLDLSAWAGQPNVHLAFYGTDLGYTFDQGGSALDNVHIYEPPANELSLSNIFPYEYMGVGKSAFRGKIENLGGDTLRTVDVHWQIDNGPVQTKTLTGLNYAPLTTNTFTVNDSLDINTIGIHDLTVWLSNPNGGTDVNPLNDTISKTINVLSYLPEHRILVEEYTGAWCCPCAGGAVSLAAFADTTPRAIISAIHIGDIMEYSEGPITRGHYIGGYPGATIDRYQFPDGRIDFGPHQLGHFYPDRLDLVDPVEITFLHKSYDSLSRVLTVEVNAEFFVDYPEDDLRLNLMITEDSLSNEFDANYDQNCSSLFPYYHRHVARATLDGAWGVQNSLPDSIIVGNYSKLFTWTVPDSFNLDHLELIGFVHRYSTSPKNRAILNANNIGFWEPTNLTNTQKIASPVLSNINIYPNPFSENLTIAFSLEKATDVSIEVVDVIGQRLKLLPSVSLLDGRQIINMEEYLDISRLEFGIYFIKIQIEDQTFTYKVIKA